MRAARSAPPGRTRSKGSRILTTVPAPSAPDGAIVPPSWRTKIATQSVPRFGLPVLVVQGENDAIVRVTVAGRPYAIDDRRNCFPVASRRALPLSQSHPGIVDAVPDRKRP